MATTTESSNNNNSTTAEQDHVDNTSQSLDQITTATIIETAQTKKDETIAEKHDEPKLSKNQLKKRQRLARLQEKNKRRKQQDKDAKAAKAQAEERDLEKERQELAERTASGEGRRRRQAQWNRKMEQAAASFQICLDCQFESRMTNKEINSLSLQIRYCYATNCRSPQPCYFTVTSLHGETLKNMHNVSGFEDWANKGFRHTSDPLEKHFSNQLSSVVYLTSDSENVLEYLQDDKIYVIGGIVDRNRLKRAAMDRAEALGMATAKLPLDAHLKEMAATKVLTCNRK